MKADFFILQVCDFLDDGDGQYRLHQPSLYLSRLPAVVVVDCHYAHRLLPKLVEAADVLVLPFLHNWDLFPVIEERRAAGQTTVFEANDYFYDIQPWNPIAPQWQDRAIQDEYRHFMAAADAVQTSTPELGRRWGKWARRVVVFRNHLAEIPPLASIPARPLTIGWGGSPGHFADWYALAPRLQEWLDAHPTVQLAVMTNEFAQPFLRLPPERYHFMRFGSLADYLKFLGALDIGLAPLLPTEYNRGRSDVKFLEYASRGVPGIYADLEPYRETVVPEQTGLLYGTEQEWVACLDRLAADASLRQRIREQAHVYVSQKRRLADNIGERLAFYRTLLRGPPRSFEIPEQVVAAAVREGNYLQLRPQEAEQAVLAAMQPPAKPETAQKLAGVLARYPDYLTGLQEQGRLLNDLRDCRQALGYLQRALALNPKSSRSLCETGRAYFGVNNVPQARKHLEAGLAINPLYFPGWQYLLRLLALSKSPDGPYWAERARDVHPRNFTLALAGARLYAGAEGVAVLHRLLECHAPSLKAEERPAAAVAFSQAILEVAGPHLDTPSAVELLRGGVEVFPKSARLADMLGYALHLAGRRDESNQAYARALEIRRTAAIYRAEFPEEDGRFHYWQFAENIRGTGGTGSDMLEIPKAGIVSSGLHDMGRTRLE
jgi:tetratricopeptide (TPR) repeat protein